MGYFNVSIAWVIGLVGLTAAREQWRKERDYRMSAARASVLFDEKVILARLLTSLLGFSFQTLTELSGSTRS